jgi:structural maintenance of chromosome 1
VVENKAVAKECINYLRDQRVGTCVFLPLDNINPPPLSEKARSFGERYKPCLHLLKFDEQYKVRLVFVACRFMLPCAMWCWHGDCYKPENIA